MNKFFSFTASLSLRTGLLSTLWMGTVLVVLVSISAFFYRDANERNFERLLNAHLYSLIAAISLTADGEMQGAPELGDIRYHDPESGWYWEVSLLDGRDKQSLKSPSLQGSDIASPPESEIAFDRNFIRTYHGQGIKGKNILILESDIVIEAANQQGAPSQVARFRIMGNEEEVSKRLDDFWATMRWYLVIFILMSAMINAWMIFLGLKPLKKIQQALTAVRTGKASHIHVDLPLEIQPMACEMNALIDNQHHMIQRFRTQIGNLAHAMKTPLTILINEAESTKGTMGQEQNQLILEQARIMQEQIQHHLQRAQMAAQRDSLMSRTDSIVIIERIGKVMGKLFPSRTFDIEYAQQQLIFAGEEQDLEEIIGNILENAGKWAHSHIVLRAQKIEDGLKDKPALQLVIEDDGDGLKQQERDRALKRGQRLDESVPGSGLGLAIVAELIDEYGGELHLNRSTLGGLRVEIILPLAAQ